MKPVRNDTVRSDTVRSDTVRSDTVRSDTVRSEKTPHPAHAVSWLGNSVTARANVIFLSALCAVALALTWSRLIGAEEGDKSPAASLIKGLAGPPAEAAPPEIQKLLAQLDAEDFGARNDATRQLSAKGPETIRFLVAALGDESREVRFRVKELLSRSFSFDDLAPHLVSAIPESYGLVARTILRDRALLQIEEAGQMQFTKKLFEFWGTDIEAYRRRVLFDLVETRTKEEAARFSEPLIGLRDKARRFEEALARLEALSLQYDHRHSSGFVIAETLAAGLRDNDAKKVAFAQRFLTSFESLSKELADRGEARATIRKEVTDRANMSDGAVIYVVRLLDTQSAQYKLVSQRLGISTDNLQNELFRGLATADARECYVCVGKVHIADMLAEVVQGWQDMPVEGVVQNLVDSIVATVANGDKPKALALLDALEGCQQLSTHQLSVRETPGKELGQRLYIAATLAASSRAYHPARSIHDRFIRLIDLGMTPDDALFPSEMYRLYLRGDVDVMAEEQRAALGRYVSIIEQLREAGESFDQAGVQRFLALMLGNLRADRELVARGLNAVTQLLKDNSPATRDGENSRIDEALGSWADKHGVRP